jgi:hypothetical protein
MNGPPFYLALGVLLGSGVAIVYGIYRWVMQPPDHDD